MVEVPDGGSRPHVDNRAGIRHRTRGPGISDRARNGNKHVDCSVGLPGCAPLISNRTIVSSANHG